MAIKRIISTEFWTDRKVVDAFSPEDKLFMFYLLTNPHTTQLGIYPFIVKIAAFEIGYSSEAVITLVERFERVHQIVKLSKATGEIAIRNYLKHSIVTGGTPVMDLLVKEAQAVKDKALLKYVLDANADNANQTVKAFVVKMMLSTNDNDNENEDSYHESYHESSKPSKTKAKQPTKDRYGPYGNVLLTKKDLETLQAEYANWNDRIDRLDEYIESKGTKYKNHLATIRAWARKDGDYGTKRITQGNADAGYGTGTGGSNPRGDGDDYSQLQVIRC